MHPSCGTPNITDCGNVLDCSSDGSEPPGMNLARSGYDAGLGTELTEHHEQQSRNFTRPQQGLKAKLTEKYENFCEN